MIQDNNIITDHYICTFHTLGFFVVLVGDLFIWFSCNTIAMIDEVMCGSNEMNIFLIIRNRNCVCYRVGWWSLPYHL